MKNHEVGQRRISIYPADRLENNADHVPADLTQYGFDLKKSRCVEPQKLALTRENGPNPLG